MANPHSWRFREVTDPSTGEPFFLDSSWEFVAFLLDSGRDLESVTLTANTADRGKTAYVIKEPLSGTDLYIKIRPGCGAVIGYSFHYTEHYH